MKISGNEVRIGNILDHEKRLWVVLKTSHTQPGKGGAYMQVEMKALDGKTKTNIRFRSAEQVERVFLEELPYQYLYEEGEDLVFMDQKTYEQIQINKEMVGDAAAFLQDGMIVDINFYEGRPLSVKLPDTVILTISEAEPVVKGQTASSSFKPAILENGLRIMVPPHIDANTRIVVNTADCTYVERAKSA
ncbi:MAG TPA: elongation factor P [Alphaproteobacteria bacterium]|nr:elongation factor P [Alphaproteobacteria bacterium]